MNRLAVAKVRPDQDPFHLRGKIKWFFVFSIAVLVLLCFTSFVRYKVIEQSMEKEARIIHQYELKDSHGQLKAKTTDNLAWNYVHVLN